jgi:hypothetical protein
LKKNVQDRAKDQAARNKIVAKAKKIQVEKDAKKAADNKIK